MLGAIFSALLVTFNLVAFLVLRRQRRRRSGEPPLFQHPIPYVGSAFDFGKNPLGYLQGLQQDLGDVFTIELAGWDTHVFMNPLDVRSLEKCKSLDHREIIGDFVTRMVGSEHSIHNQQQKEPGTSLYQSLTKSIQSALSTLTGLNAGDIEMIKTQLKDICDDKDCIQLDETTPSGACLRNLTRSHDTNHAENSDGTQLIETAPSGAFDQTRASSPHGAVPRPMDPDAVPHSIDKNLRGSMQLSELCCVARSAVVNALRRNLGRMKLDGKGSKVELYDFCKRVIFDITFNLFFGSLPDPERSAEETDRFYEVFQVYFRRSSLLVDRVPIHFLPDVKEALRRILAMIGEINWAERSHVSQLIADIVNVNPRVDFSEQRSRHLMIILWSAQANTAPALFWTLFHLVANPDARRAVMEEYSEFRQEERARSSREDKGRASEGSGAMRVISRNGKIRRSLRSREGLHGKSHEELRRHSLFDEAPKDDRRLPDMSDILNVKKKDLDKMVILDGSFKETMRLTGSSMSLRRATADCVVRTVSGRNYVIRKGDFTTFFAQVTHMDEEIYENPNEFVHDRYLVREGEGDSSTANLSSDSSSQGYRNSSTCSSSNGDSRSPKFLGLQRHKTRFHKAGQRIAASRALMTFGYGSTRCPGRHIAMIEIKLVVLALFEHFALSFEGASMATERPGFDLTHLGFGVMPPEKDVSVTIRSRNYNNNNYDNNPED